MKRLYAPWRSFYAKSISEGKKENGNKEQCDFCTQLAAQNDEKYFILKRTEHCFVCLNLYPYNSGHLMVLPLNHVAQLNELSAQVRTELMELVNASTTIAQQVLKCQGVNIGINLGKAAGAGIPSHLHAHVLPRWSGDTNFLPLIADVKVVSFDLHDLYKQLKPAFQALSL